MPTGSHFTATLHGESVADRDRARPCAAHSLRLRSPRRFSSRERWEGIEHHAAPRPPPDLAAGAVRGATFGENAGIADGAGGEIERGPRDHVRRDSLPRCAPDGTTAQSDV